MEQVTKILGELWSNKTNTTLILALTGGFIAFLNLLKTWLKLRNYFKQMNIPGPKPMPVFGNFLGVIRNGMLKYDMELFKTYPGAKTIGYFEFSSPVILTTDPKFLKSVFIKDFSTFVNHRVFDAFLIEPTDKFLQLLKDDEWKSVRALLTTTFTSGKLKAMSKCIDRCLKTYTAYLNDLTEKEEILETKKFFGCYTFDVISSCCFGMDICSIEDPDNVFIQNLKIFASASKLFESPKFILMFLFPTLAKFLAKNNFVEFIPKAPMVFLQNVTNEIIQRRKSKKDNRRDDFIQSMIDHEENISLVDDEMKSNEKNLGSSGSWNNKALRKTLTNNEIMAMAIQFLLAGYETTATTMEFITYSLATNQTCQDKLIEEIDRVLDQHNGEINYESISEMKYMDMVIEETLRIYPVVVRADRVASADYEYNDIKIKKGQVIMASIYAMHHDPDIYPEPEQFRPERFDEAHKKARDNEAYMPFSFGPRNCIGMRFALMEMKLLLSAVLSKYRFGRCEKTPEKIVFDKSVITKPLHPIFLKIQRR